MERRNIPPEEYQLLACLSRLPKKIMSVHGLPNATEFILYALCRESGLPVQRVAYLVDNPDFDWCKGVAGFSSEEQECDEQELWDDPDRFTQLMLQASFNQKVRSVSFPSVGKDGVENLREHIRQELSLNNPSCFTCGIKNDNVGILIVDDIPDADHLEETLHNAVCLLGMCPIF